MRNNISIKEYKRKNRVDKNMTQGNTIINKYIKTLSNPAKSIPAQTVVLDKNIYQWLQTVLVRSDVSVKPVEITPESYHLYVMRNQEILFEFINDMHNKRGCIFAGNEYLLFSGNYANKELNFIFDLPLMKMMGKNTTVLEKEAQRCQNNNSKLKPLFDYVLPILTR